MVHSGVGDDDQTGFLEGAGDVVGEGSGCETASDGLRAGVGGVFEHGAVAVGAGGDGDDVVPVYESS